MRARGLGAVLFLLAGAAAAEPRPTSAAMRKAFEGSQRAVVEVHGPRQRGSGVIVGADGHVVTSVEFVALEKATVRIEGTDHPARVLTADARLGVAVVKVDARELPAAAVRLVESLPAGTWLVGITHGRKGPKPSLGQVRRTKGPFLETDLKVPAGSPLFDRGGKLVAISVGASGRGCRALLLSQVSAQLRQATP